MTHLITDLNYISGALCWAKFYARDLKNRHRYDDARDCELAVEQAEAAYARLAQALPRMNDVLRAQERNYDAYVSRPASDTGKAHD